MNRDWAFLRTAGLGTFAKQHSNSAFDTANLLFYAGFEEYLQGAAALLAA